MSERCLVCGTTDPLGLPVCPACGGSDPVLAGRLLFVLPASRRRDRWAERVRLALLTGQPPRAGAVRAAARGVRALALVPAASADAVMLRLRGEGITTNAVHPGRAWAAIPLGFWLLTAAATLAGVQAGQVGPPSLLLLTPLFTTALVWSAIRGIRRPLLPAVAPRRDGRLPVELLRGLVELPPGLARNHLAGLAQAVVGAGFIPRSSVGAGFIPPSGFIPPQELADRVRELIPVAVEAARELDQLDRTYREFEGRARGPGDLPADFQRALDELQVARGRLIAHLLEVTGLVGRLQGLTADALGSAGERLAELAKDLRPL